MAYIQYVNLTTFQPIIKGATSAGTGNILVSNLPFISRNVSNLDQEIIIRTDSLSWPAGTGYIIGEMIIGDNSLQIIECRSNAPEALVQVSSSGQIHFTGFYTK